MKTLISNYAFDASEKTITFSDYESIALRNILIITNVTDQIIIYNFADTTKGGSVATNVLTLEYDSSSMSDTDVLQIWYWDTSSEQAINDGGNAITVDGTVAVTNAGITTIAGAVSGTEMQVDVASIPAIDLGATDNAVLDSIAAAVGTEGGALADGVLMQGDDGTDRTNILVDTAGHLQMDILTIATNTNTLGKLASNSGTDIGDVDILSIAAGDNNIGNVDVVTLPGVAGDVAGNAADSGNPVKIGGKYNSTAPTFDDGDRGEIQISSRGNILAELKSGTTSMQNGNGILTQGGIAHDSADAGNPIKIGGKASAALPTAVADADRVNAFYDLNGRQVVILNPADFDIVTHTNYARKYYTSSGAATDGIIWSPAAGKRWHITSLIFQTSADATITFEDDKSGGDDPVLKGEFKAGSGLVLTFDDKYPFASGEDAADFTVTTSAGNIYVAVVGYEI